MFYVLLAGAETIEYVLLKWPAGLRPVAERCGAEGTFMGVVRDFFSNWREYEGHTGRKLGLAARNRFRATVLLRGCCGHHGEPGC